jgi:hypothetical protein
MHNFNKIFFFSFTLSLIALPCVAQNLVPNCSFEDTVACPNNPAQINKAIGWSSYGASPDYFNACSTPGWLDVPDNFKSYQNAVTGKAYAGIVAWVKGDNDTNYKNTRELIGIQLLTPLTIGANYYLSFKASCSLGAFEEGFATNKLGARFSTIPYSSINPEPVNNFAHVFTNDTIKDTVNWTTISGWVIADSAYQYIIVGNFFKNGITDSIVFDSTLYASYYFIDDVCVSLDSTKCSCDSMNGIAGYNQDNSIIIFPNPAKEQLVIQLSTNDKINTKIYDCLGILLQTDVLLPNKKEIQIEKLSSGIYILQIEYSNTIAVQKIIIQK